MSLVDKILGKAEALEAIGEEPGLDADTIYFEALSFYRDHRHVLNGKDDGLVEAMSGIQDHLVDAVKLYSEDVFEYIRGLEGHSFSQGDYKKIIREVEGIAYRASEVCSALEHTPKFEYIPSIQNIVNLVASYFNTVPHENRWKRQAAQRLRTVVDDIAKRHDLIVLDEISANQYLFAGMSELGIEACEMLVTMTGHGGWIDLDIVQQGIASVNGPSFHQLPWHVRDLETLESHFHAAPGAVAYLYEPLSKKVRLNLTPVFLGPDAKKAFNQIYLPENTTL